MRDTKELGFVIPQILLPREDVNMAKWSCVACDQFTSQPEYWDKVEKLVGNAPSTLHMVLPEVYLESDNVVQCIDDLKTEMHEYLNGGIMGLLPEGIVLTERHLNKKLRKGILLAMDLEQYDFKIENKPLIRATEQTVLSRIPPRMKIRNGAPLELPHIMLLMDDPEDSVIGPLHIQRTSLKKIYDFDLMMDGGKIEGWLVDEPKLVSGVIDAIAGLKKRDNMLFCVGDGNHSLATAKAVWDEAKQGLTEEERENHPLRFALCEIINLRDRAVEFMPIHRVLFGVNASGCAQFVTERLREKGRKAKLVFGRWRKEIEADCTYQIPFLYHDGAGRIVIEDPQHPLAVGEVQEIFEEYIAQNPQSSIDYIHGDEAFLSLSKEYDNIGFYFDSMDKSAFFDLVVACGVLPKKTFSLGEAEEKRYYLEGRMLTDHFEEETENTEE
ncbi:MAG: DUF1015 domain-containing protein [Christensenella sp.]|uniref:DUF1015 domain-containing protein n=1 Tax=Christensenella sp. TaxID=1935934 RepID=UPI002B1FB2F8|nr:DUF1015 domain-containing protein [Christensenella sp.]MEA5003027.1 DUF1015 domain-containing protein [Christensenella sp.]